MFVLEDPNLQGDVFRRYPSGYVQIGRNMGDMRCFPNMQTWFESNNLCKVIYALETWGVVTPSPPENWHPARLSILWCVVRHNSTAPCLSKSTSMR